MRPFFLCLNELSLPAISLSENEAKQWERHAQELIKCLKQIAVRRSTFDVLVPEGALAITICNRPLHSWLPTWMGKTNYQWFQTKLKQGKLPPEGLIVDVKFKNTSAEGLTRAHIGATWAISLAPENSEWDVHTLAAQLYTLQEDASYIETECSIRHLGKEGHAEHWQNEVAIWGETVAENNVIADLDGFSIEMYPNDHLPPHIHLVDSKGMHGHKHRTIAKYRIDKFSKLESFPAMDEKVATWIAAHEAELLGSWERCIKGYHPVRVT